MPDLIWGLLRPRLLFLALGREPREASTRKESAREGEGILEGKTLANSSQAFFATLAFGFRGNGSEFVDAPGEEQMSSLEQR